MKILINTSNLYVGGGVQVALSFINELKELNMSYIYHIFLSLEINKQIEQEKFPNNFYFYIIDKSPASLKTRKKIVTYLNFLTEQIEPDIVFTIFGPSYWKPKTIHLTGFADGWVYNPNSVAYDRLSFFKRIKMKLYGQYKSYYLKKDANYFILETIDAKKKLSKVLDIQKENIFVVGNTHSTIFNDKNFININNPNYIKLPEKEKDEYRLIYIAHNHISKNLQVINEILPFLKNENIKFVLTLDDNSFNEIFPNQPKQILNIGVIKQKSCPSVYKQCDALFAPTLLETFSAIYPEAMKMKKPILTSNYSFAIDVCQNAAFYFDPLDPKDIADKIITLSKNKKLQQKLIRKGIQRLKSFETAEGRARKYIQICEQIVNLQI